MLYERLHKVGEDYILDMLKLNGRRGEKEFRMKHCVFDVYDPAGDTVYEVLTAKFIRSMHEHDEEIIAKMFKYLLYAKHLKFYIVSYGKGEINLFNKLRLQHWHLECSWSGNVKGLYYHAGKTPRTVVNLVLRVMKDYAPIKEWIDPKRRMRHKKVPDEFGEMTKKYNLPKNFLQGLWRDWHLHWVQEMEKVLPRWSQK